MALNASKAAGTGGPRAEPLPPENYMARVVQVIDLGVQNQRPYKGTEKPPIQEIMVTYELGTEFMLDDDGNPDETRPRWVSERLPLYNLGADKAKSTKRYMALDPNVEKQGDWSQLVGSPCLVAIVNNEKDGRTYNNVGGITPAIKGIPVPELVNEGRYFDFDAPDMDVFNNLPEWIQGIIKDALNFKGSKLDGAMGGKVEDASVPDSEPDVAGDDDDFPL